MNFLRRLISDVREEFGKTKPGHVDAQPTPTPIGDPQRLDAETIVGRIMDEFSDYNRVDWNDVDAVWSRIGHRFVWVTLPLSVHEISHLQASVEKGLGQQLLRRIAGFAREDFRLRMAQLDGPHSNWDTFCRERLEMTPGEAFRVSLGDLRDKPTLSREHFLYTKFQRVGISSWSESNEPESLLAKIGQEWLKTLGQIDVVEIHEKPVTNFYFRCRRDLGIGFKAFLWVVFPSHRMGDSVLLRDRLIDWILDHFEQIHDLDPERFSSLPEARASEDFSGSGPVDKYRKAAEASLYGVFVAESDVDDHKAWIRPGFLPAKELSGHENSAKEFRRFQIDDKSRGYFTFAKYPDVMMKSFFVPFDASGNPVEAVYFEERQTPATPVRPTELVMINDEAPSDSGLRGYATASVPTIPHFASELDDIWRNPMGIEKGYLEIIGLVEAGVVDFDSVGRELHLTGRSASSKPRIGLSTRKPNYVRHSAASGDPAFSHAAPLVVGYPPHKKDDLAPVLGGNRGAFVISPNEQKTTRTLKNLAELTVYVYGGAELQKQIDLAQWQPIDPGEEWELPQPRLYIGAFDERLNGLVFLLNLGSSLGKEQQSHIIEHASYSDIIPRAFKKRNLETEIGLTEMSEHGSATYGVRYTARRDNLPVMVKVFDAGRPGHELSIDTNQPKLLVHSSRVQLQLKDNEFFRKHVFQDVYYLERNGNHGRHKDSFAQMRNGDFYVFIMHWLPSLCDNGIPVGAEHVRHLIDLFVDHTIPDCLVFWDLYDRDFPGPSDARIGENVSLAHGSAPQACVIDLDGFGLASNPEEARILQGIILCQAVERAVGISPLEKEGLYSEIGTRLGYPSDEQEGTLEEKGDF